MNLDIMNILIFKNSFSSAHFYRRPEWSEQENRTAFGACSNPHGHGHDYILELGFQETPNTKPMELEIWAKKLAGVFDHHHLNFQDPFRDLVPTTENIAQFFWKQAHPAPISYLRLYETPDLWVEISA